MNAKKSSHSEKNLKTLAMRLAFATNLHYSLLIRHFSATFQISQKLWIANVLEYKLIGRILLFLDKLDKDISRCISSKSTHFFVCFLQPEKLVSV